MYNTIKAYYNMYAIISTAFKKKTGAGALSPLARVVHEVQLQQEELAFKGPVYHV
jgi:hypothetical protein